MIIYAKTPYGEVWHLMDSRGPVTECGRIFMKAKYASRLRRGLRTCKRCAASPDQRDTEAIDVNATFSNFQSSPIYGNGVRYPTVEHYFQAMKMARWEDHERIRNAPDPGTAKRLGNTLPMRSNWPELRREVMLGGLRAKFAPGTHFARELLATGDRPFVEWNSWHDNIWGQCTCRKCRNQIGDNLLGRALEQVRRELRGA